MGLIESGGSDGAFESMEKIYKDFKLERLGDGEKFVEATCPKCRKKLTIELDRESIAERLELHAEKC